MTVAADGVASSPDGTASRAEPSTKICAVASPRGKGNAVQGISTGRHKPASVDGPFRNEARSHARIRAPFPFQGCALVRKTPQPRALANRQNGQDRACDTFGS